MTANPLEVATAAKRPLPASEVEERRELLEVELLIPEAERRADDDELDEFLTELRQVERNRP